MRGKRLLAWTLSLALLVGMLPGAAFAAEVGPPCENHPEHTGCGYVEGSPCGHTEHTADCYTDELICGFDGEEQIATDSEATEPHEHGPDCHALDCPHERGEHDGTCGYVEAQPCGHACELCTPQDSGDPEEPTSGQNVQKSLEPEPLALGDTCNCTTQCVEQAPNTDCPVCGADGANLDNCAVRGVLVYLKFYPQGLNENGVPYDGYEGDELFINVGASGFTVEASSYPATIEVTPTNAEGTATGPAVTYHRAGIITMTQSEPAASVDIPAYPSTGDDTAKGNWMTAWADGLTVAYVQEEPEAACNCTVPCTGETIKQDCPVCKDATAEAVADVCAVKVLSVSLTLFPGAVSEGRGAVYDDNISRTVTVGASGKTTFTLDNDSYPETITIEQDVADGPKKGTYQRAGFLLTDEQGTAQTADSVEVPAFPSTGDETKKSDWDGKWGGGLRVAYVRQEPEPASPLVAGETYWFDLSGAGIPTGTLIEVNDALPDNKLHWVPFTYTGEIDAYKLTESMATTEEYATKNSYPHSLFVADYNVVKNVTWDELDKQGLIFGKSYTAGNMEYTLRAPSVGSRGSDNGSTPVNNEWDQVPMEYIKNYRDIYSWGQDSDTVYTSDRAIRGYYSARFFYWYSFGYRYALLGFRPVLEFLNADTLTSDGLRVVTVDLRGGKIGTVTGPVKLVVAAGEPFDAPSADGIRFGTKIFESWQDSEGNTYSPGALKSVPDTVETLTAIYKDPDFIPSDDDDDDNNYIAQPIGDKIIPIISSGTSGTVTITNGTNTSATGMTTEEVDGYIEALKESFDLAKLLQNYGAEQAKTGANSAFPVLDTVSVSPILGTNITAQPGANGMDIQFEATQPPVGPGDAAVDAAVDAASKITKDSTQAEILAALEGLLNLIEASSDDAAQRISDAASALCGRVGLWLSAFNRDPDGSIDQAGAHFVINEAMKAIANRGNTGSGMTITPGNGTGNPYTVETVYGVIHILKDGDVEGYIGTPSAGTTGTDASGNETTSFPLMKVSTGSTTIQSSGFLTISNGTTLKAQLKGVTETSPFILCRIQYLALSNPFTDVAGTDWFYQAVMELYSRGIMQGTSATTFSPQGTVTRAQAAQVLYNMDGRPQAAPGGVTSDIPADAWYADAAAWAMGRGIVQVTGDRFGGDDPVSRQELVEMLYRYAKYKGWDVSVGENTNILSYKDFDQIGEAAVAAFQWACGAGIVQGDGNGYLHPQDGLTRAELAQMLQRALDRYKQPAAPVNTSTGERKARRYKVQKGDTLSGLAGRYHTTVAAIVEANPIIKDPSFLLVGWELDIP